MYYKESDSKLIPAPVNFKTPNGSYIMNFNKSPQAMATFGWRNFTPQEVQQWYKEHTKEPVQEDTKDFDSACQQFRTICSRIGSAIDQPNFKGGFDEMALFEQSPVFGTIQGLQLAISWSAANELCKHQAKKLGMDSPEWFYKCWEQAE